MLKENEPLAGYTVYKIGGPARFFARISSREDVFEALHFAKTHSLPVVVLGGGSNVLVSDRGVDGLVLKMEDRTIAMANDEIVVGAGAITAAVSKAATDAGLSGLEWAFGIPGTIGGAVRGNAGAFGSSIAEKVISVEIYDTKTGEVRDYSQDELQFSYRKSAFATNPWIALSARLRLAPLPIAECKELLREFLERKKTTQPLGGACAGCSFKNADVSTVPRSLEFPAEFLAKGQIPAGYLLDRANMKNHVIGRAMVSPKHANFIVNLGGASAQDVRSLLECARERVFERFGIRLEEEIQYIGEF